MRVNKNGTTVFSNHTFKIGQEVVDKMVDVFLTTQSLESASEVLLQVEGCPCVTKDELSDATMLFTNYWARIFGKKYDESGVFIRVPEWGE